MRYLKPGRLYCFSPLVMLATFVIELSLAVYVLIRYRLTPVIRVAVVLLLGLAVFQLAEYNICETAWGISAMDWAKIGYVAITLLPPLALHLIMLIASVKRHGLVAVAYGLAAVFAFVFLVSSHGVQSEACHGNYAVFSIAPWAAWPFAAYYYGLLLVGVYFAVLFARQAKKRSVRRALFALAVGYAVFIVPTTLVNIIDPSTIEGIPSIMCGFAVLFAVIVATVVVPAGQEKKKGKTGVRKR